MHNELVFLFLEVVLHGNYCSQQIYCIYLCMRGQNIVCITLSSYKVQYLPTTFVKQRFLSNITVKILKKALY